MNANNPTKRPIKKLLTALLCTLVAVSLTTVAAAWFAGIWSSTVSFPVQTGGNPDLKGVMVWMYSSVFDGATTEQWEVVNTSVADGQTGYVIPSIQPGANTTDQKFALKSLHFGRIDNLISLNEDNKIYFRFQLSKQENGSGKISFTFDYAEYTVAEGSTVQDPRSSIHLFNMQGQEINHSDPKQNGLQYDSREQAQLLNFSYCVSSKKLTPNDAVFATDLTFSGPYQIMDTFTPTAITGLTDNSDTYYLYVCMAPTLENYGLHENIMQFFAQSFMVFDVKFAFEVYNAETANQE